MGIKWNVALNRWRACFSPYSGSNQVVMRLASWRARSVARVLQGWSTGSRTATPVPELSEAGVAMLSDRYQDTMGVASGAPPPGPPAQNCPAHHRRYFAPGSTAYPRVLEDPPWRALLLPAPMSMLRPLPPRTHPACPCLSHLLRYHHAGPNPRVFGQRAQPVIRYVKSQLLQVHPLTRSQSGTSYIRSTTLRSKADHLGRVTAWRARAW
jgi:hypothetical protein